MKRAIFPGSFDPFTLGHLDVVERAAAIFDEVIVCTSFNIQKANSGLFIPAERHEIVKASIKHLDNVFAIHWCGLLADAVKKYDVDAIVKGVRNGTDFDWEMQLAQINRGIIPTLDTVLFPSKPEHMHISSTATREMIRYHESLDQYLHPDAIKIVQDIIDSRLEDK